MVSNCRAIVPSACSTRLWFSWKPTTSGLFQRTQAATWSSLLSQARSLRGLTAVRLLVSEIASAQSTLNDMARTDSAEALVRAAGDCTAAGWAAEAASREAQALPEVSVSVSSSSAEPVLFLEREFFFTGGSFRLRP